MPAQLPDRNLSTGHDGAWGGLELRHLSRAQSSPLPRHGSPAQSTLHGRLAQDATFGEFEGLAVCSVSL
jgi:hypothetical protein